jgi:dTDP-4-amino-4,6-dideoxygalactose transaminase
VTAGRAAELNDLPDDFIVFGAPVITEEDVHAVAETLRSGWLGPGPEVHRFEEEFKAVVDAPAGVAVSTGTAALHLALLAIGLEPGDEVVTSPITWPASANAIVHAGGVPVFADVGEDGNIDLEAVEAVVRARTRALLPIHLAGLPCDVDGLVAIGRKHDLTLIQDTAHAIETRWNGRRLGAFGTAAYSFNPTKNLTTGGGGMVVSHDQELLARVALLSQHGVSTNAWSRRMAGNLGRKDMVEPGFNLAMTDLQASLGRSQLRRLEERHGRRRQISERYQELLAEGPVRLLPPPPDQATHAHHLFLVLAEDRNHRDALRASLFHAGIGTGVHFEPVHLLSWYRERFGYRPGSLPTAERFGSRTLSLPLSPSLSDRDVERVVRALTDS